MKAEALGASEEDAATPAEAPIIMLGPLESRSCLDELSDGVQSMDVRYVQETLPHLQTSSNLLSDGEHAFTNIHLFQGKLIDFKINFKLIFFFKVYLKFWF